MKNWGKVVRPEDLVIDTDITTNISIGAHFLVSIVRWVDHKLVMALKRVFLWLFAFIISYNNELGFRWMYT